MMGRNRERIKGRKESGSFIAIPKQVLESEAYAMLGASSVKLLIDLTVQYNGHNNGDLCAAWSILKKKGWKSKGTLHRALRELQEYGFIYLTRQGGKHKPSLYALTFRAIDDCGSKLDVEPTRVAANTWKNIKTTTPYEYQCAPYVYQSQDLSTGH